MSLKAFHVFFMIVAIALCAACGAWAVASWRKTAAPLELTMALTCGAGAVGLGAYLRAFLRKWKRVSYL